MDEIQDIVKKVIGDISSTKKQDQKGVQDIWDRILSDKEKNMLRYHD